MSGENNVRKECPHNTGKNYLRWVRCHPLLP